MHERKSDELLAGPVEVSIQNQKAKLMVVRCERTTAAFMKVLKMAHRGCGTAGLDTQVYSSLGM